MSRLAAPSILARRPRLLAALAIGLSLLAAGAAWDAARTAALVSADPDTLSRRPGLVAFARARGGRGFAQHCANCHGADARGNSALGAPNLTDRDWLYGSGATGEIEAIILYGVRAPNPKTWKLARMPAYARALPYPQEPALHPLSPGDIGDVTAFLLSMEGRAHNSPASVRGEAIFHGRGGCYDCHGQDAQGDPGVGAPNLTDDIWLYGHGRPGEIADSLAYGRAGVCPAWAERLSPGLVREIAVYVHQLSPPA